MKKQCELCPPRQLHNTVRQAPDRPTVAVENIVLNVFPFFPTSAKRRKNIFLGGWWQKLWHKYKCDTLAPSHRVHSPKMGILYFHLWKAITLAGSYHIWLQAPGRLHQSISGQKEIQNHFHSPLHWVGTEPMLLAHKSGECYCYNITYWPICTIIFLNEITVSLLALDIGIIQK